MRVGLSARARRVASERGSALWPLTALCSGSRPPKRGLNSAGVSSLARVEGVVRTEVQKFLLEQKVYRGVSSSPVHRTFVSGCEGPSIAELRNVLAV